MKSDKSAWWLVLTGMVLLPTWGLSAGTSVKPFGRVGETVGRMVRNHILAEDPVLSDYVRRFNADDAEVYTNAIANAEAEGFLAENIPRFTCPDKDIERTYYFRWWTYRKHLRHDLGVWTVSEFLPDVPWGGQGNAIVCPAGHHIREGRWLKDPKYVGDLVRFWLSDPRSDGSRWRYASWLYSAACGYAEVTGREDLLAELLDSAVAYYERWEQGFERTAWPREGTAHMGGDGHGGFLSIDNYEGSEFSLGGHGYRPLFGSAMWSEAKAISDVAARVGRKDIAERYRAKAEAARKSILAHCWNEALAFFTTGASDGTRGGVRELHGYAPWYFGLPTDGRKADWSQLSDAQGFAARFGLSFPERRAQGFALSEAGHECQWNGPSWPYATSVALTALANDIHARRASGEAVGAGTYVSLLKQYAAQHRRVCEETGRVLPWIDENLNPDTGEWLSRKVLFAKAKARNGRPHPFERGKDYNHSTYCDLVITGLVGFIPQGKDGFSVDPLFPEAWDYLTMEGLRYRGHDVSIRWGRGTSGLTVDVDGHTVGRSIRLARIAVGDMDSAGEE